MALAGVKLWTSVNQGRSFPREIGGSSVWDSIACNSLGDKLIAGEAFTGSLYRSGDGGITWNILPNTVGKWRDLSSNSNGMVLLAVDYGNAPFVSTNGGQNWVKCSLPAGRLNSTDFNGAAISATGLKMAVVTYIGGVYTSKDTGGTWTQSTAFMEDVFTSVAIAQDDMQNYLYVTTISRVFCSSDFGVSVRECESSRGQGPITDVATSRSGQVVAVSLFGGGVLISVDAGASWNYSSVEGNGSLVGAAMSQDGAFIAVIDSLGGVYSTTSYGGDWITLQVPLPRPPPPPESFESVAMSSDAAIIAVGGSKGSLYISRDGGATFNLSLVYRNAILQNGQGERVPIGDVGMSSDGRVMAITGPRQIGGGGDLHRVQLSFNTGVEFNSSKFPEISNWFAADVSADGQTIMLADSSSIVWTFQGEAVTETTWERTGASIQALGLSGDGQRALGVNDITDPNVQAGLLGGEKKGSSFMFQVAKFLPSTGSENHLECAVSGSSGFYAWLALPNPGSTWVSTASKPWLNQEGSWTNPSGLGGVTGTGVAMSANGVRQVVVTLEGMFYSKNSGDTFASVGDRLLEHPWTGVACDSDCSTVIAVTSAGEVFKYFPFPDGKTKIFNL